MSLKLPRLPPLRPWHLLLIPGLLCPSLLHPDETLQLPPSPTVWDCTPPHAIRSHVLGLTTFVGGVYGRRLLQCFIIYALDPPIVAYLSALPLFYLVKTFTTSTSALLLYLLYTTPKTR